LKPYVDRYCRKRIVCSDWIGVKYKSKLASKESISKLVEKFSRVSEHITDCGTDMLSKSLNEMFDSCEVYVKAVYKKGNETIYESGRSFTLKKNESFNLKFKAELCVSTQPVKGGFHGE
jgi:hypothetical protein